MANKLIFTIFAMAMLSTINAQASPSNIISTESEIQSQISKIEKAINNNPNDLKLRLSLARILQSNGQKPEALKVYEHITSNEYAMADAIFEHAEMLRSQAEFTKAKQLYIRYADHNPSVGNYFANTCDYAINQLSTPRNCDLENLKDGQDIAINYKNTVITNSQQLNNVSIKEAIPNQPIIPALTPKSKANTKQLQDILENTSIENTNLSFNDRGNMVAFSEKSLIYKDKNENLRTNRGIFFADVDDQGQWSNVSTFTYNNPTYSACYPSFANQGNTLYFSSNMAGGYGGYDLYVSHKLNGQWGPPSNLGALINSPGNEISAFYKSGDLFYSSDWHKGFGGFDIFRTSQYGLVWTDVENMGPCVNSTNDDFNFILNKDNDGYFNSNREGSEDKNGIYKTNKLILKANIPSLRAISNDEISFKSGIISNPSNEISTINNTDIVQSVDDPAISFMPAEQQLNKLYFVQIAAISNFNTSSELRLKNYTKYANVYKSTEGNVTKIRLGGYSTLNEALSLMKLLKKNGFKDVFVVADIPTEGRCVMIHKASGEFAPSSAPEEEGKLKIRVSEFKAPDWFDSSKISDLGKIEHWTKNGWTIIILGSFKTPDDAIKALDKVRARGFKESYIVIEENGRLYRQN